jgi:hypothetical protein
MAEEVLDMKAGPVVYLRIGKYRATTDQAPAGVVIRRRSRRIKRRCGHEQ